MSDNIKWMSKTTHLDELKPEEFIEFIEKLCIDPKRFEISEKIDGQNLSFGVDSDGRFFTKTKRSNPVYDSSFYDGVPFLKGFKAFHEDLQDNTYVRTSLKNMNKSVQFFGELVPYPHTNTIQYSKDRVGKGSVVLFGLKENGLEVDRKKFKKVITRAVKNLSFQNEWNFLEPNIINISVLVNRPAHFKLFKEIHKEYKEALNSLKHKHREPKRRARSAMKAIQQSIKRQILDLLENKTESVLGAPKPEGFIIRNLETNRLIKLVDKSEFTEQNREMHESSKEVDVLTRKLKTNIRKDFLDNVDILSNYDKLKEKIADQLLVVKQQNKDQPNNANVVRAVNVAANDLMSEIDLSDFDVRGVYKLIADYKFDVRDIEETWEEKDREEFSDIAVDVTNNKIRNAYDEADFLLQRIWTSNRMKNSNDLNDYSEAIHALVHFILGPKKLKDLKNEFKSSKYYI